jgi:hypothetical protein
MMEVNTREETTWVLWALINYFKVDAQWTNQWGQAWSMEALVRQEVAADTPSRPCGGNHNLFVLSRARDKYLKTGRPLRGVWFEADQKVRKYIEYARSMQNPDGTFSSNSYKGPGYTTDMNLRFNTTGHALEFLSVGLPQERLNEQWVRNAVHVLSSELIQHRKAPVDCGPLYHSLNALIIYRHRLKFGDPIVKQVFEPALPVAVVTPAPAATPSTTTEAAPATAVAATPMPETMPTPTASQPTTPTTTPMPAAENVTPQPAPATVTPPMPTMPESPVTTQQTPTTTPMPATIVTPGAANRPLVARPAPMEPLSTVTPALPRVPAPVAVGVDLTAPRLPTLPTVKTPRPMPGPISALDPANRL